MSNSDNKIVIIVKDLLKIKKWKENISRHLNAIKDIFVMLIFIHHENLVYFSIFNLIKFRILLYTICKVAVYPFGSRISKAFNRGLNIKVTCE